MAPFRVLIKGDSHYGLVSSGVRRDEEVDEIYRRCVQEALRERVDAFIDLGDLTDKGHPTPRQYGMIISNATVLSEAGIPALFIGGNHDTRNHPEADHALEPLSAVRWPGAEVKVCRLVEAWRPRPDVEVLALPYVYSKQLPEGYEDQQNYYDRMARAWLTTSETAGVRRGSTDAAGGRADREDGLQIATSGEGWQRPVHRLAVAHLNLGGARKAAGDATVRDIDVQVPPFLVGKVPVFVGHLHAYQVMRAEHPPAVVVGSTQYVDFGEARDRKGFVIYESPEA